MSRLSTRSSCCLCRKTKEQVSKLIVGLDGAVCNGCVELCNDILRHDKAQVVTEGDWDGTIRAAPGDRDVFHDASNVQQTLAACAELVRNYIHTMYSEAVAEKESPGPP